MKTSSLILALTLSACLFEVPIDLQAAGRKTGNLHKSSLDNAVLRWNEIAIDATGFDHAGARQHLGPGRASRAMSIAHISIYDAVIAVEGGYQSFTGVQAPRNGPMSVEAAIAQAAHDTLSSLYSVQKASFDAWLAEDLSAVKNKNARDNGVLLGQRIATAIMTSMQNDGSETPEPVVNVGHMTLNDAGHWRQDPISLIPLALGAKWGQCLPFVLESSSQFRCPAPPAMNSAAYAAAYNEVKSLGGDGITTPTDRTPEQTYIGVFWAYDGVPNLCAPPRLYNQITTTIADIKGTSGVELARMLALVNLSLSDATLSAWESKYYYDVWRPITGIRESDAGTGPLGALGLGDGNPNTEGDTGFTPLGAPASNANGPNFTPPFPAYPSGHASMGGALFQMLRNIYGTDNIPFTFVSDEFNGVTRDNQGVVRALIPRSFNTLSQAEEENGQSRMYLGIHWAFDKTEGITLGRKVADYIYQNALRPLPPRK